MSVPTSTIAKRLEEILESISDAFVSLDADWHYVYVNKRAGELSAAARRTSSASTS